MHQLWQADVQPDILWPVFCKPGYEILASWITQTFFSAQVDGRRKKHLRRTWSLQCFRACPGVCNFCEAGRWWHPPTLFCYRFPSISQQSSALLSFLLSSFCIPFLPCSVFLTLPWRLSSSCSAGFDWSMLLSKQWTFLLRTAQNLI